MVARARSYTVELYTHVVARSHTVELYSGPMRLISCVVLPDRVRSGAGYPSRDPSTGWVRGLGVQICRVSSLYKLSSVGFLPAAGALRTRVSGRGMGIPPIG